MLSRYLISESIQKQACTIELRFALLSLLEKRVIIKKNTKSNTKRHAFPCHFLSTEKPLNSPPQLSLRRSTLPCIYLPLISNDTTKQIPCTSFAAGTNQYYSALSVFVQTTVRDYVCMYVCMHLSMQNSLRPGLGLRLRCLCHGV